MFTFSGDVMLHLQSLSPADIKGIRQSWGLAKDAAPFEVHGPAFYRLYDRDIFYLLYKENSRYFFQRMFENHPPWRHHFNHMGGHLPLDDHTELPRYLSLSSSLR